MQQLQPLRPHSHVPSGYSCDVAAGLVQAANQSKLDRVESYVEDDGDRGRRRLRG